MEHLPAAPGGRWALEAPYLPDKPFSFDGEWIDYPNDQNIQLETIRYRQWAKIPLSQLAPFLQNWLFFGLLRAVLPREIPLDIEDFIRLGPDGKKYITTVKLPDYLLEWMRILETLPQEKKLEIANRNETMFREAQDLVFGLTQIKTGAGWGLFPPLPLECAFSCALLGMALQLPNALFLGQIENKYVGAWTMGELPQEQLELQGWCPFLVSTLVQEPTTTYYISTLGGPKIKSSHRKCSEHLCVVAQNRGAQHTNPTCGCSMLGPNITNLVQAVRQDATPIMQFVPAGDGGKPVLNTIMHNSSFPYVAISHVWSDGLGNPDGNQANICQLERIQQGVDQIFHKNVGQKKFTEGWWWLDSLSIPKGDLYKEDAGKAIEGMKEIYLNAKGVLLIEAELCLCEDTIDPLEVFSRLRMSNWVRRLWTFQEGLFAKEVYILIGKTPRSLVDLVDESTTLSTSIFQDRIVWDLMNFFRPLFTVLLELQVPKKVATSDEEDSSVKTFECPFTKDKKPITERLFSDVVRVVCSKSSTFARDEALCLAFLLNLGPDQIKEVIEITRGKPNAPLDVSPPEFGMMKLLELASLAGRTFDLPGCIPPSIIFSVGPRIRQNGFRWAPESFLSKEARYETYSDVLPFALQIPGLGEVTRPSGTICEHGLRVMFPGLIITKISGTIPLEAFFIIDTSRSSAVRMSETETMPKLWRCKFERDDYNPDWADIAPTEDQSNKLAIIVGSFEKLGSGSSCNCILVAIKAESETGELRVSRLGKIIGSSTPEFDDFSWLRQPWNRAEGRWLPLNQIWCVDGEDPASDQGSTADDSSLTE